MRVAAILLCILALVGCTRSVTPEDALALMDACKPYSGTEYIIISEYSVGARCRDGKFISINR